MSVNTYKRSLCACGMLVCSEVDVTSYGGTDITVLSVHVGCSCVYSKVDVTPYCSMRHHFDVVSSVCALFNHGYSSYELYSRHSTLPEL